ncbi:amino acid adenylation domain-containing protein [Rugosimonospora africana]|uniref:Amino acid adenylation protein n=1 Tax=Rugosimonospora africana TaxID=556532 RepID=A0A8J3QWI2_9ACTN|nr:amino acid adenylation domain-containing protein [Rugosimonospora africana]GIH17108.1 amino acid adenylation protein [Rugosimonospora africana]
MSEPRNAYVWFDRSADAYGDSCHALEVAGERLTYAELRGLAERLAARLVAAHGGSAPRRVGLLASRSVVAYAGYLAVLRAGAAVVPLNPEHPASRIRRIVDAAGIDLVLADTAGVGADLGVPKLVADPDKAGGEPADPHQAGGGPADPGKAGGGPAESPEPTEFRDAGPDDIAYIIFTSGSTGVPKGVPITHRNLNAYLGQMVSRYEIGPGSRVSGNFDLTFDGSVHDLFVTWACGGTLVVPQRAQLLSPVKAVNALRLSHWFSVPSLVSFAARLGTLVPGSMPTLRWSLFGGEAVALDAARQWQSAAPNSRLEVLYGPTELTIACTAYRLAADPADWPHTPNGTVPIGTCLPALEFLLLDENGAEADHGELCARGPQRFAGYLDPADNAGHFRPADGTADHETADHETADHETADHGTADHWYRTGDRVAWHDGVMVHLGRIDHQIKVRGHRIELGEIEAALRRLPGVRDATVVAVQAADGEPELAAAVTGRECLPERLYAALGEHLPPYMLPRRIAVLDQLPLNANGKVDRSSLLVELARSR